MSCWFDWWVTSPVVQGVSTLPIKPTGRRHKSGTGKSMIRSSWEAFTPVRWLRKSLAWEFANSGFRQNVRWKRKWACEPEVWVKGAAVVHLRGLSESSCTYSGLQLAVTFIIRSLNHCSSCTVKTHKHSTPASTAITFRQVTQGHGRSGGETLEQGRGEEKEKGLWHRWR